MQLSSKKVLLVGGKGGVGKTTVSSSLAMLTAKSGKKVLLVSTDPAHSLSDVFNMDIGDRLHHVSDNLTVMEIDPDKEVKEHIERVSAQMKRFTNPDLFPEIERQMRLTQQSPGAQEAAMLERICKIIDQAEQDFDLLVFDTAPTGHTLRLLSLPEAMAAWTQGMLRSQKRSEELDSVLEHLSPKAGKDINNPMADPSENASDGMTEKTKAITEQLLNRQRLFQRTRRLLQDPTYTGILFVLTPERLPINETQRALQSLTEEKLPVSGVIINRILPESIDGGFLAKRKEQEQTYLKLIESTFSQWPNFKLYLQEEDIHGVDALSAFAKELEQSGFSV